MITSLMHKSVIFLVSILLVAPVLLLLLLLPVGRIERANQNIPHEPSDF